MALTFTRSDGLVYLFTKSPEQQHWVRSDTSNVHIVWDGEQGWHITDAKSGGRLGWPAVQSHICLGGLKRKLEDSADRDVKTDPVAGSDLPPAGVWMSEKLGKRFEYVLEHVFPPASKEKEGAECSEGLARGTSVAEYARQEYLRPWGPMLDKLWRLYRERSEDQEEERRGSDAGSEPRRMLCYDLGCGAGAITRRFLGWPSTRRVVALDMDRALLGHAALEVGSFAQQRQQEASFRIGDLSRLGDPATGGSLRPDGVWELGDVAWSSFVTAYFPGELLAAALLQWAHLLRPGGLLCLVDICGLFSAHGLSEASGAGPETEQGRQITTLFERVDQSIVDRLQNDVFVGAKLEGLVREDPSLSAVLEVLDVSPWEDAELAFDGSANDAQQLAWKMRMNRPGIRRAIEAVCPHEEFQTAFLDCLRSEHHVSRRQVCMLVCRRRAV